nr:outer membrane lipoprotein-sorting protein [Desulfobulbus rhabdoformis]
MRLRHGLQMGSNWLVTLGLVLFVLIPVGQTAELDGTAILKQVDANLQPQSYEMYRKLINIEPDGSKKEFVLYSVKKGQDKMVALFLSPASEKGRSTLRLGDNMWLYIPNVGKPLRITSLQSGEHPIVMELPCRSNLACLVNNFNMLRYFFV